MKILFKVILVSFVLISNSAGAAWRRGTLKSPSGQIIRYEQHEVRTKGPTLLFLPGIYRGQMSADAFTQDLLRSKMSFVFIHFAEQPDSIVETAPEDQPDFSRVSTLSLAEEVETVADQLKLENVIPVTLSYSAVLTQSLNRDRFPFVIEVAPIAKQMDQFPPDVIRFYEAWEAWVKAMPFGEAWLLGAKRVQLHQVWSDWLKNYKQRLPKLKDPVYFERAIQGYTALTLAADDFDLRDQDFKRGPRRFFILGEKEDSYRAQVQREAIANYQRETGHAENVLTIKGAGHVIMADQPEEFVQALGQITKEIK